MSRSIRHLRWNQDQKAFTLNELLVSVAILGILSAITIPVASDAILKARIAQTQNNLRQVSSAIEAFAIDQGKYPYGSSEPPTRFMTNYDAQEALQPLLGAYLPDDATLLNDTFTQSTAQAINQTVSLDINSSPSVFGYGYYDYSHFMVPPRNPIRGYGVTSFGPDEVDSSLALCPLPGIGSLYKDACYQPSNGLRSVGDLGSFGGGLSFSQHIP
ncbi:MAG: prepilin-type N-terminal cleavage/methylation domain-containing protein [Candidatus Hinthialibacter antarcticus]|nr:prepilin-type N-terminal cleavage/methylation domain-containing protein [Candidatus Hinthialibacter antarcticus]